MGIPLMAGRNFSPDDQNDEAPVLILNESGARTLFPGQDPLGKFVSLGGDTGWEVVGIGGDTRHQSLESDAGIEMYFPNTLMGWGTLDLVVRSPLPVEALLGPVAGAIRGLDPTIPTGDFQTLKAVVDRSVSPRRFTLLLLGAFAGTALILAALGIYGVLSYSVSQSIPEIGIRMALGESRGSVLGRVVGRTMALAGMGVVAGAGGAFLASRLLASLLFGVEPTDPLTFGGMTAVLLMVSALAGFLPARRASRTDPMAALRTE
jgi:predicted permease